MMVSEVRYPSFKSLGLRSTTHFHQGDRRGAVRRLHPDFAGKNPLLRPAGVFHGLSALWLCAAAASRAPGAGKLKRKTTSRTRATEPCWTRLPFCWPRWPVLSARLLFSSIPVGPINLTILNEGAQRGFTWAMLIGLGASAMEVIYCAIAFTGFSSLFRPSAWSRPRWKCSVSFSCCFSASNFLMAQTRQRADQARRRLGKNRGAPRAKIASALGVHDRFCARDGQPRRAAVLDRARGQFHVARLG